jgi:hypothetical protein
LLYGQPHPRECAHHLHRTTVTSAAPRFHYLRSLWQSDVVATHYAGEDNDNDQSSEEILLSVADRLEEVQLPELALRLPLCSHIRIPNENKSDHLAEVEKVFAPKQAKKPTAKKKTVKKTAPPKSKNGQEEGHKRIAA